VKVCKSGEAALKAVGAAQKPDMILLDIMMPGIDGFATLARLRDDPMSREIPVIFISALDNDFDEDKGLRLGAVDYITKPFKPTIVMARVNTQLELKQARDHLRNQNQWLEAEVARRVQENQLIQDVALISLTQLAETRDDNTGNHILRTCKYVEILARRLQLGSRYASELNEGIIRNILKAAPLHDIGKIGIPDAILLKKGKLTPEEFEIIKTHCQIGAKTLRGAISQSMVLNPNLAGEANLSSLEFLEMAEIIAKYHHEKWDGTGYPTGIRANMIPLPARLMALADVFDALTTVRPYKNNWSFEEASEFIRRQKGFHFDPDIVEAFEQEQLAFAETLKLLQDN
jgi:putative two-component system response regulator